MPRVSVIIAAYNAAPFLPLALDSVLHQTFTDWEIILVDDGSKDGTRDLVLSKMTLFGSRLHYIHQSNRGVSAARNTAIRHASGEFMALLDADDVWLEKRLELGVTAMDRNREVGLVHGKVVIINSVGDIISYPMYPPAELLQGKIAHYIYERRVHLASPTILFRKECIAKVGDFDESMPITEDRDLCFRIAQHYQVAYIEDTIAHYRVLANSLMRNMERVVACQVYFVQKHRASPALGPFAPRRAMARICGERGNVALEKGAVRESLSWYGRGLLWYPFETGNVHMFLRALSKPLRFK